MSDTHALLEEHDAEAPLYAQLAGRAAGASVSHHGRTSTVDSVA